MDFVSEVAGTGKRLKIFTLMDESTRECLAFEIYTSITGERVASYLIKVALFRGLQKEILTDNGPEFISNALNAWCYDKKVFHVFTDSGCLTQNGYIKSFNGKLRDDCLNKYMFDNIIDARGIVADWKDEYNNFRPHSSLKNMTSKE